LSCTIGDLGHPAGFLDEYVISVPPDILAPRLSPLILPVLAAAPVPLPSTLPLVVPPDLGDAIRSNCLVMGDRDLVCPTSFERERCRSFNADSRTSTVSCPGLMRQYPIVLRR
jgi:hypothetical protein